MMSESVPTRSAAASDPLSALKAPVEAVIRRVLDDGETVLATVEAVEVAPWRERISLGGAWAFSHLVLLVITDHRLLEVALRPKAGKPAGRVREIVWSRSAHLTVDGKLVRLGDDFEWLLRQPIADEVVSEVSRIAHSEAQARKGGTVKAWRLCTECGLAFTTELPSCRRCGSQRRSLGMARALAWLYPGAGLLYATRPVFSTLRWLLEVTYFAVLVWGLMVADGTVATTLVITAGVPLLLLVKLESDAMTRALAERSGPITPRKVGAWRKLALAGLVTTVIVATIPFFLAGRMSASITSDLDAIAGDVGWSVSRDREAWQPQPEMDAMRAQWNHREGWTLRATAEPFAAFESAAGARSRWLEDPEGALAAPAEALENEGLTAIRRLERVADDGDRIRVRYVIIDDYGRDSHLLSAEVEADRVEALHARVGDLLPCLFWTANTQLVAALTGS